MRRNQPFLSRWGSIVPRSIFEAATDSLECAAGLIQDPPDGSRAVVAVGEVRGNRSDDHLLLSHDEIRVPTGGEACHGRRGRRRNDDANEFTWQFGAKFTLLTVATPRRERCKAERVPAVPSAAPARDPARPRNSLFRSSGPADSFPHRCGRAPWKVRRLASRPR
jgi:hypothetical protein